MPTYDSIISRSDAAAMVPEQVSSVMLNNLQEGSAALALGTRVPVSRNQTRFPVLSALPVAYFVNGDTGLKQTTEAAWSNKYLDIEEIATIVPIPEAVLDDAGFDIWGAIRPLMENAISRTLDKIPTGEGITPVQGDASDSAALAAQIKGADAVISALHFDVTADQLLGTVKAAGVNRLLVMGGAASLKNADGVRLYDSEGFPEAASFMSALASAERESVQDVVRSLRDHLDRTSGRFTSSSRVTP